MAVSSLFEILTLELLAKCIVWSVLCSAGSRQNVTGDIATRGTHLDIITGL